MQVILKLYLILKAEGQIGQSTHSIRANSAAIRQGLALTGCKLGARSARSSRAKLDFTLACFILAPSYSALL